jgi:hypothetical protein
VEKGYLKLGRSLGAQRASSAAWVLAGSSPQERFFCILFHYFLPQFSFGNFWLTIQNTANRHVSNAFDLIGVFISFPLARALLLWPHLTLGASPRVW